MKITNMDQVNDFLAAVDQCKGDVWLVSNYGDKFNLKSKLSQIIGIGELLKTHGDELELFCDNKEDEQYLFDFFREHPEV